MESVSATTEVVYVRRDLRVDNNGAKGGYDVDIWQEVRKRWMVLGVLVAMALAVLAPHFGAPGGLLHSEYVSYVPLSYIYFAAGRKRSLACRARVYALTTLHAQVIAFAMCAVTVNALSVALDRRVIEGALLAAAARPCAWLPLSLRGDGAMPALAAVNYASSFLLSPLAHLLLIWLSEAMAGSCVMLVNGCRRREWLSFISAYCGGWPLPAARRVLLAALAALVPFALGSLTHKTDIDARPVKVSALVILYTECCQLLREAEGSLYVTDVMATLFLVISWLATVAASSGLYVKCGLLTAHEAQALLLVSTPKTIHIEWMSATLCSASGLARLPAVFMAPAQALLLAAIAADYHADEELPT